MPLRDVAGQSGDDPARVVAPVGSIKSRECGYEIRPAVILDALRQFFNIAALFDQAQVIAPPLHQGPRNGNATFQRVLHGLIAKFIGDSRQQAFLGKPQFIARIHHQKTARTIGVFCHARLKARLSDQCRVLIAQRSGDGYPRQGVRSYVAVDFAAAFHFG